MHKVLKSAHDKAELLQNILLKQLNNFFPEKTSTFSSDDQPWIDTEFKNLDRKKEREYCKNRKSQKWKNLNKTFKQKCLKAKSNYYSTMVADLKNSHPRQWYSKLKRMSSYETNKN